MKAIKPIHPLIAEQVSFYYFQKTNSEFFEQNYIYYPNYGCGLNVYLDASISWDEYQRIIKGCKKGRAHCILTMTYKKSRSVRMLGQLNKLGIIFRPLGINHFISGTIAELNIKTVGHFDRFW